MADEAHIVKPIVRYRLALRNGGDGERGQDIPLGAEKAEDDLLAIGERHGVAIVEVSVRILDHHTGALDGEGGGLRLRCHQPAVEERIPGVDRGERHAVGVSAAVERDEKRLARDRHIGAECTVSVVRDDVFLQRPRRSGGVPPGSVHVRGDRFRVLRAAENVIENTGEHRARHVSVHPAAFRVAEELAIVGH